MIREKYVEERHPRWFVFGSRPGGGVDISDGTNDVLEDVPPALAERIVEEHNKLIDLVVRLYNEVPDEVVKRDFYGT